MKFSFPWLRSLMLVLGVGLVAGLFLAILDRLLQIYGFLAPISPILAIAVVVVLVGICGGLGVLAWRSLAFLRPSSKRDRPIPKVSQDKMVAATENLQALQLQVEQIQDQVAKQTLLHQSETLLKNLQQTEYKVVIFGTGSAGKTSLANAILARQQVSLQEPLRVLGEVAATMGTTLIGEIYSEIYLEGFRAPLQLIDCPGILEAGVAGTTREEMARQLATEADLLLFVVDHDLTQSEYLPLKALVAIGKRSLLVLNKIDRFTKADSQAILVGLQQRTQQFLDSDDVVAIAACPSKVRLESGEIVIPQPKLETLLARMQKVLNQEGKDLVADNVLWRSQQLSEASRSLIQSQRQLQAEKIIEKYQWVVVGVIFSTPLPVIDMLATAAINAQMIVELAKVYGCEISLEQGKELAGSLGKTMASLGIVKGVVRIMTTAISVTVVGYLLRATVQAATAAYLTRIAGYSFMAYFSQNQDWGDGGIAEVVEQQFQLNRRDEFMKVFIKEAVTRVLTLAK